MRPLISVQDVSNAFFKVLKAKNQKVKNEIFNVGGHNENYKIIDIVHLIKNINLSFSHTKQIGDRRNYRVSFKKIKNVLAFRTNDNLEKVIKDMIKKYKKLNFNPNNVNFYNDSKIRKILNKRSS